MVIEVMVIKGYRLFLFKYFRSVSVEGLGNKKGAQRELKAPFDI